jgi:DNA polymerase V
VKAPLAQVCELFDFPCGQWLTPILRGFPSPADDHLQKQLDLHEHLIKHPAATFFAHVQGASFKDANIYDGDLLIIDRAETPGTRASSSPS